MSHSVYILLYIIIMCNYMFSNASIYVCIFREQAIGVFWGNNSITTSGSLGTAVETNQIIGTHSV